MITRLAMRDVRCFPGEARGEVRRITLLVGENSAGKSTFLGCYRALARLSGLRRLDDEDYFDRCPFPLGDFESIARNGASNFGLAVLLRDRPFKRMSLVLEKGNAPYPAERKLEIRAGEESFRMTRSAGGWDLTHGNLAHGEWTLPMSADEMSYGQVTSWLSRAVALGHLPFHGELAQFAKRHPRGSEQDRMRFGSMVNFLRRSIIAADGPIVVTPATEARKRQYPDHPLSGAGPGLLEGIGEYGAKAGLFSGVRVMRRDRGVEVLVEMPDDWRNLMDVGRGVHAVLPLLREMRRAERPKVFLLEEPERCLHPTAQAELAQLMAEGPHHFLIETHSDYFLDRFRICVMRGQMDPADLHILYFEPGEGGASAIHDISVDEMGNLDGAPPRYREFFDRELDHLMGLGAD